MAKDSPLNLAHALLADLIELLVCVHSVGDSRDSEFATETNDGAHDSPRAAASSPIFDHRRAVLVDEGDADHVGSAG